MNTEYTKQQQFTHRVCFMIALLSIMGFLLISTARNAVVSTFTHVIESSNSSAFAQTDTGATAQVPDSLKGKPTISATFIDEVLAHYHSPAQGTGTNLYALGKRYGIDPVYALAFFMHESSFGTAGVATVTHSLGNIRCAGYYWCISGYRAYWRWQDSYQAWYHLIGMTYMAQWNRYTVEQIIPVYAPSGDHNNVSAYIAAILHAVSVWRSGTVEVS